MPTSRPAATSVAVEATPARSAESVGSLLSPAREQLRRVWGVKLFIMSFAFVVALSGLGMYRVWTQYQVYALGQDLSKETLQYRAAREENQRLTLELSTLKEARTIRARAERRLRMHQPAPQEVVEIRVQSPRGEGLAQ